MKSIKVKALGPIKEADINFGDLTLFVGPQASGKSILLQLIKLLVDKSVIEQTLNNYGFVWGSNNHDNLDRFFGEGMFSVWNAETSIVFNGHVYDFNYLQHEKAGPRRQELFYVPAQRVMCLNYGWPRFFNDYEDSVPYVLKDFSEQLRQYMERGITEDQQDIVFPQKARLNTRLNASFDQNIFHGSEIVIDKTAKKRFKLNFNNTSLPYMTWSAGQKEFMPLLLSFYWLCQPTKTGRRKGIDIVIIEEPEMGLHPQAIKSVMLQVVELLSRGYQVIISTHSPVLLEFAWAYNILKELKAENSAFDELLDLPKDANAAPVFDNVLSNKTINTYYFDRQNDGVTVSDISSLDAGSDNPAVAEWGGLSSFSAKANDIVATTVANNG